MQRNVCGLCQVGATSGPFSLSERYRAEDGVKLVLGAIVVGSRGGPTTLGSIASSKKMPSFHGPESEWDALSVLS